MPQNPDLIATKTVMGEVYVFDRTKHPSQPTGSVCKPDITLRGHSKEGSVLTVFGPPSHARKRRLIRSVSSSVKKLWTLVEPSVWESWALVERFRGHDSLPLVRSCLGLVEGIASFPCSDGSRSADLTGRDINGYSKANSSLEPLAVYKGHTSIVEVRFTVSLFAGVPRRIREDADTSSAISQDVAWHNLDENIFASVGDDRQLLMYDGSSFPPKTHGLLQLLTLVRIRISWDTRGNAGSVKPTSRVQAHEAEVNAVAFAPHNENILITGSADKVNIPNPLYFPKEFSSR